jgi:glycosyltransferase involved in cell wall biosynthesis
VTAEPTVSVLTTCYNREAYLGHAIESVLSSSFTDLEYIVVDDASSDRSVEIAREYAKSDTRVKVFVNESNLGDYLNRNRAASLARGTYLKYVDSDDLISPHGLQVMVDCMRAFPEAALGLSCTQDPKRVFPFCLNPEEAYARHFFGPGLFSHPPLSAIIRRDCFEKVGGFSGRRYVGDIELWLTLARHFSVVLMPLGLTWCRGYGPREYELGQRTLAYPMLGFAILQAALSHAECPLMEDRRLLALHSARTGHALELLGLARRGYVRQALKIAQTSQLGVVDLYRALLRRFLPRSLSSRLQDTI